MCMCACVHVGMCACRHAAPDQDGARPVALQGREALNYFRRNRQPKRNQEKRPIY